MSVKRNSCFVLAVFFLALFFVISLSASADDPESHTLFPDGNGGFILLDSEHNMTYIDRTGKTSRLPDTNFEILTVVSNNNESYAVGYADELVIMQKCSKKREFLMAGITEPKSGCIAVNDSCDIFLANESIGDLVYKIAPDGQTEKAAVTNGDVELLFFHNGSGKVFALTSGGVTDVAENRFIPCKVPVLPIKLNNNICADADGNVYSFSEEDGFVKKAEFHGFRSLCCTDNAVFMLRGSSVIKADINGNRLGEYTPADNMISEIASSGESVAVVCGGKVKVLKDTDLILKHDGSEQETAAEPSDEPFDGSSEISSGKTSEKASKKASAAGTESKQASKESSRIQSSRVQESSVRDKSRQDMPDIESRQEYPPVILESSRYNIENGIVNDVPYGTTVAALKKELSSDGDLRFFTYKGKETKSGKLGTGATVEVTLNGKAYDYRIVVPGDVTGEGSRNTGDTRMTVKMYTGEIEPDKYQLLAADMNRNGIFDIQDVCILCGEYYMSL